MLCLIPAIFCFACSAGGDDDDDHFIDGDDDDNNDDNNDDNDTGDMCREGIAVPAFESGWIDAGLHLAYGDTLTIGSTGEITLTQKGESTGPDGIDEVCGLGCPAPELNRGTLLGKVSPGDGTTGVPFLAGLSYEKLITEAGNLYFIVNDDSYEDNAGYFCATAKASQSGDDDDDTGGDDDDDDDDNLPAQCSPENFVIQVIDVAYGTTAGFGRPFVPDNVLGPPVGGGDYAPQSSATQLLSLGEGGQITLKMGRR